MSLDSKQIDSIVDQVVRKLSKELSDLPQPVPAPALPPQGHSDDRRGSERRYGTAPLTPEARPQRAPAYHRGRKGIFDWR
jgi:hypothetical protein